MQLPRNDELFRYFPENFAVLKMTWLMGTGRVETLKLEGELLEACVGSVRDACAKGSRPSKRLRLDLAAVSYVDAPGAQLLRDLMREGIPIVACSDFVAELLELEERR